MWALPNNINLNTLREIVPVRSKAFAIGSGLTFLYVTTKLVKCLKPKKQLLGEIVVVTGGAGSLGGLLAKNLASLGAIVVVWDVNQDGIDKIVKEILDEGGRAHGFRCDLCDRNDIYNVARKTADEVGDVTILINNAGVVSGDLLLNVSDQSVKRTFDVNVLAHFWTTKAFLPKMIDNNHGHIVTVASLAGHFGVGKLIDYCSSKFAAVGFDEALRSELFREGISGVKTTCICPYYIRDAGLFTGIKSRYPPPLRPIDVSKRVIKAIRNEEEHVVIGTPNFFLHMKHLVPICIGKRLFSIMVPNPVPSSWEQKVAYKDLVKV